MRVTIGIATQVSKATMSTVTTAFDSVWGHDALMGDKATKIARIRT